MLAVTRSVRGRTRAALTVVLVAGALLAGCSSGGSGPTGAAGPAGAPGPSGSPHPGLARDLSTAQTISAEITGVTGGSTPTVAFRLLDQNGAVVITDQFVGGLQFGAPNTPAPTVQYIKAADGSTKPQFQTETCSICHGPGAVADVKVVHQVASFKYN